MNTGFEICELEIEGIKRITPFYMEDNRGYFLKSFEKDVFAGLGVQTEVYEEFESYSIGGVIRGLHFQTQYPQSKLVRVIKGEIRDVVVDLRKGSKTFGKYMEIVLNEKNHYMLWISAGFAHGFEVLSEYAIMSYKCFGKYRKEYDTGIRWNDKDLSIKWTILNPILSQKDTSLMTFDEFVRQYSGL